MVIYTKPISDKDVDKMLSMTGYGRGTSTKDGFVFSAEMRSVNHRYADFVIRLPRELYSLEDRIRRLLQGSIVRGRVELNLSLDEYPADLRQLKVNYDLAEDYYHAIKALLNKLKLTEEVRLQHILSFPDLFRTGSILITEDQVWPVVEEALNEALEQLLKQRKREGENLCFDLLQRCSDLDEKVELAARQAEQSVADYRLRTKKKLEEYLAGNFEETRLLMECAILVERMNVDEEIVRLRSHLNAFRIILKDEKPAGRKLDFIVQEILREINTIGSKSGDYQLTNIVVDIKAELEKVREQIQNLE